jgi:hypothetical protein
MTKQLVTEKEIAEVEASIRGKRLRFEAVYWPCREHTPPAPGPGFYTPDGRTMASWYVHWEACAAESGGKMCVFTYSDTVHNPTAQRRPV